MAKNYSKETSFKRFEKDFDSNNNCMDPSDKSIQFILNYSKCLSVRTSEKIGPLFLSLN